MRSFEILLSMANLAFFSVLVTPHPGTPPRLKRLALLLLFMAPAQILIEGARWQMIPAYAGTGALLLPWLVQHRQPVGKSSRSSWKRKVFIGAGLTGIALTFALPALFPVFQMPPPEGPYRIGTLTYHWKDQDRRELYTNDPSDVRELMIQLWYPAKEDTGLRPSPYLKDPAVLMPLAHLLKVPGFAFGHLKYITTNAREAAPAAGEKETYPVLIFSHGRGGYRQHNSRQIEELVSNGYVVASIDHTYAASGVVFPDGRMKSMDPRMLDRAFVDRMIPYLAQDVIFTLNQLQDLNLFDPNGILTGKLNLQQAGIFGLSMGGQVAAEASLMDPRLKACLVMDVEMPADVIREGLLKPTMWISRDKETMKLEGWSADDIDKTHLSMRTVFEKLPAGYIVLVPGMFHPNFSDAPYFSPLSSWFGLAGPINKETAQEIVSDYSLAFFDRHLRGRTVKLLEEGTEREHGVLFETR